MLQSFTFSSTDHMATNDFISYFSGETCLSNGMYTKVCQGHFFASTGAELFLQADCSPNAKTTLSKPWAQVVHQTQYYP